MLMDQIVEIILIETTYNKMIGFNHKNDWYVYLSAGLHMRMYSMCLGFRSCNYEVLSKVLAS